MNLFDLENEEKIDDIIDDENLALLRESYAEMGMLPVELLEKSTFLLDKNARVKKAASRAAVLAARSANDPLYAELSKLNKKRMILKKKIDKKYQSQARVAMKAALKDGQVRRADIIVSRAQKAIGE